jgi:hypothetical protein
LSDRVSRFCLGWPQTFILLSLPPKELGLQAYTTTYGPQKLLIRNVTGGQGREVVKTI